MTKADLIEKVVADAGVTKTQADKAITSFISAVTKTVKKGDKVTLVGFGTFSLSKRKARKGRNPKTGEVIKISASKTCRFSVGKGLKDALNK